MYLLFDIGGTKTRIGIAEKNDQEIIKMEIVPTAHDFQKAVDQIISIGKKLSDGVSFGAAAGGVAVPLDKDKSMAIFHSEKETFKDWVKKPLKKALQERIGAPVYLENDAAIGALGEAAFGAGKGNKIVAFITIGTGVGGARIVNEKIDESSMGFEPGWQIIDPTGTLYPECKEIPMHLGVINGESIKKRTGKIASEIKDENFWDQIAKLLALGLYNTTLHWSPDIIVLGGSISKEISIEKTKEELEKIPSPFRRIPEIKMALLDEKCGLYGALQYLRNI